MQDPTKRFSDRAETYAKYRPRYPDEMLQFLEALVAPPAAVADVGSGTGILTAQLLKCGYDVWAVEPNEAMRTAAERTLSDSTAFRSVVGTAEATTLEDRSIDLITCAQAFHWFERVQTRLEFSRILKSDGWVALLWNERQEDASPINRAYDDLLQAMASDYQNMSHRRIAAEDIRAFFAPGEAQLRTFANSQTLDCDGFLGRLMSSSYVPNVGQPGHQEIVEAAKRVFEAHQAAGKITFEYETKVYVGRLSR
jgi:ubiquinone/menaquinone biosynthesis C-methylase UbiE